MPEVERVSGKHRPRRGRGRDETALAWVKWGSILVVASLASFFVSLYWIAPRVYPSRSPADTSPQVSRDEADLTENRVALPTIEDRERVGSREHKPRPATESVREARPETRAEESRHVAETLLTGGTTGTEAPQSPRRRSICLPSPPPLPGIGLRRPSLQLEMPCLPMNRPPPRQRRRGLSHRLARAQRMPRATARGHSSVWR